MANEITYTGSGANTRAAEIFNRLIWETLVDKTDLRATCMRLGDLGGSGSDTLVTPTIAWDDPMAAANTDETTAAGNTALGNGAISLSIAQQIISYEMSDKEMITGGPGNLSLEMIADKIGDAYVLRFTDQVCANFTSFTAIVSDTGVNMTTDHFYSALALMIGVPGPWDMALYTQQFSDLVESIRGEGGPAQFTTSAQNMLFAKSAGFMGDYMGVRLWALDSVGTDGPDSNGAIYGMGAIVYAEASPSGIMPGAIAASVPAGSPVYAEYDRTADPGLSAVVGHAFNAVGIGENARGVEIKTDR